jgi:hypothetical protein
MQIMALLLDHVLNKAILVLSYVLVICVCHDSRIRSICKLLTHTVCLAMHSKASDFDYSKPLVELEVEAFGASQVLNA